MKVGLYFGSFNPIHIGHLIIANHVVEYTDVEQVWLVVSPQNPLKPAASLLNEYQRLHLVQLAIENNAQLKASDVEFKLPKPSYTIDTLVYLEEKYPHHRFSIILGGDSFSNIGKWKNAAILQKNYHLIIYQRPEFAITNHPTNKNITVLNAPLLNISATTIRQHIKQKKSIAYLVTDKVREEIEKNGYYK
ncbi:MAG: nicotinate (nicotinamide) nucleotide adenylyltransferase [Flavobacterium sp.]|nr:nicotinate (nicotinamide) nucleotide adenylyltransferase [Flavobacterium sp.]